MNPLARARSGRAAGLLSWLLLALAAGSLGGCTGAGSTGTDAAAGAARAAEPPPVTLAVQPDDGSRKVRPDRPISVTASNGRLTSVSVQAAGGRLLRGALAEDGSGWTSSQRMAPGTRYTVTAQASGPDGGVASTRSVFRTLTPKRAAVATFQPGDGWTVGVGMPVIVNLDRAVKRRAAVERALTVTSKPAVVGAWRWFGDQQLQWRPKSYWPAGARVSVTAALKGVELAPGTWGTKNSSTDFRVGSRMITTVDTARHMLTVRRNGTVLRTIPVTTGKPGFETRRGIKVIMSRETTRRMDAATTGTDPSDPDYYNILVQYAMRLTWSGEFLHAAPWSVGSQGRANVSHGCTGMSTADARWLFDMSKVGDVVVYRGSSRPLEPGNGFTAWDMSWKRWRQAA